MTLRSVRFRMTLRSVVEAISHLIAKLKSNPNSPVAKMKRDLQDKKPGARASLERSQDAEFAIEAAEWLAPFFSGLPVNYQPNWNNSLASAEVAPNRNDPTIVISHCQYDDAKGQLAALIQQHPDKLQKLPEGPAGYYRNSAIGINVHLLDLSAVPGFPPGSTFRIIFESYDSHANGW